MLLEDPDVKRWYDNLARGSRVTADVYFRRLGGYSPSATKKSPTSSWTSGAGARGRGMLGATLGAR